MNRKVTENDFRKPEYTDANPDDYEFRSDGAIVRKDRWESGIQSIRFLVGIDAREFEIFEVVDRVREQAIIIESLMRAGKTMVSVIHELGVSYHEDDELISAIAAFNPTVLFEGT